METQGNRWIQIRSEALVTVFVWIFRKSIATDTSHQQAARSFGISMKKRPCSRLFRLLKKGSVNA